MTVNIILNKRVCPVCNSDMKLVNNKSFKDECCWCYAKRGNKSHDVKTNITNDSIFESTKTDMRIIYFILTENFINNFSINQVYYNCKVFTNDLNIDNISRENYTKIYNIISNKIKEKYNIYWSKNYMGLNTCIDGRSKIEIDESKFITYDNEVRWLFGIVDRGNYDIRIFYVNNNRQKETLPPIIKEKVYTYPNIIIDNHDNHNIYLATRIYSDSFSIYQTRDFNSLGFKLYKVNHSYWWGYGSFHTNAIENVWSQLKRLTKNFAGYNGYILNKMEEKRISIKDYVNSLICTGLFFMKIEHEKLGLMAKKNLLFEYLRIE